jgi:hypothetical protein
MFCLMKVRSIVFEVKCTQFITAYAHDNKCTIKYFFLLIPPGIESTQGSMGYSNEGTSAPYSTKNCMSAKSPQMEV